MAADMVDYTNSQISSCWRYQKAKGITKKRAAPFWRCPLFLIILVPSLNCTLYCRIACKIKNNIRNYAAGFFAFFAPHKCPSYGIPVLTAGFIYVQNWLIAAFFALIYLSHIYLHLSAPVKRCCPFYCNFQFFLLQFENIIHPIQFR